MPSEAEAIEALTECGLSEYEARCFVSLTQLSEGTAKEISQLADIPQSRVYDITEQLYDKGLIDIQQSDPKRYTAMSVDLALTRLEHEYTAHLDTANEHLQALEGRNTADAGVWQIANREDIILRLQKHISEATDDVYLLVAHEDLLYEELIDSIADAADRDLSVTVEVPSPASRDRLHEQAPTVAVAVTDFDGVLATDSRRPGRMLMADDETILLSARREGLVPNDLKETGIWGTELGHGLVVWAKTLLNDRRKRFSFHTANEAD